MAIRWGKLYEGTPAERSLEDAVAALGVPYRVQFPGWKYGTRFFPDFFLPTLKLVIEVDDKSHERKTVEDEERSETMARVWGVRTVRCTNKEALDDPQGTVRALLSGAGLWPLPSRLPRLQDALPPLRKAPKKMKREQLSAARQARRSKSIERHRNEDRDPEGCGQTIHQNRHRAPTEVLQLTQVPQVVSSASIK